MLYPNKGGNDSHTWFLDNIGHNLLGETVNRGSDSEGTYYTIPSDQVRAHCMTKYGYDEGDLNTDHGEIDLNEGGRGHMMKAGGWRDVEMTGYFMGTASSGDTEFVMYCRGARHNGDACEGFAYKAAIDYSNGECRVRKEQWHPNGYVSAPWREGHGGGIRNKWTGFKFICVNRGVAPNITVYMEIWIDKNNNNQWQRVYTFTDSGQSSFGGDGDRCGGHTNQIGTWSGPWASFRWDISGMRFKKLSVREIKEEGSFEPPPPPGDGEPPPPPGGEDNFMRLTYGSGGITASGDNGNVAGNVNDQNLETVWTHETLPAWIKIDMQATRGVGYIKIAFTKGDERTVGFNVELSLDNSSWNKVFTGSSSGATEGLQRFDFTDTNARFCRVNVTSNSQKNTASIKEIELWGLTTPFGSEPPPEDDIIPRDPAYLYTSKRHSYHVNYEVLDACAVFTPEEG
jgi:hypothetical protein